MRRAEMNLNERIRRDIEAKIFSGNWPPGHRIPNEIQFVDRYHCSRMTVNKVLSALAARGVLERRRGAGSFVANSYVQSAVLEIRDIKAEVVARGDSYAFELLARKRRLATPADQRKLGVSAALDVLALHCRHFANGRPIAIEDRLINLDTIAAAGSEDFSETPPGSWLLDHVPWTEAEHNISAINADSLTAKLLDVPIGTACLVMERKTWRARKTVTFVHLIYPGMYYHLVAHFTPARRGNRDA